MITLSAKITSIILFLVMSVTLFTQTWISYKTKELSNELENLENNQTYLSDKKNLLELEYEYLTDPVRIAQYAKNKLNLKFNNTADE